MSERLDPLAMPLWGSRLIEASAGTGKTWTIAALYVRLVLGHGDLLSGFGTPLAPSQILVMTFTKAATRELVERIRARLVQVAQCFRGIAPVGRGDRFVAGLLAAYPEGKARDLAGWRLATAAESMDDAAVLTIDAWVQRVLREHAFDSGSLFDETLQPDDDAMLGEAVRDYWRREVYPLARATQAAVLAVWGDVDALGVDARRLIGYVAADVDNRESLDEAVQRAQADLLALKRSRPIAVDALRTWFAANLDCDDSAIKANVVQRKSVFKWLAALDDWLATPHRFALDLSHTAYVRLTPEGMRGALKTGRTLDIPPLFAQTEALFDRLRAMPDPAIAIRRHAAVHIATGLLRQKQRSGVYNFTDMLQRLEAALRGPNGDRLRERVVAQFPVALIDEFQDTSALQYRVFDRLYRTNADDRASDDATTALVLIGDPKQSIYSFRGADIASYLRARHAVGDRHYVLGTNFRASGALVDVVNRLFAHGEEHPTGAFRFAGIDGGPALPFTRVDAQGRRERFVSATGPRPALTFAHETDTLAKSEAERRLAERCAEDIVVSLADPRTGFDDPVDGFRRLAPADITVLVRTRHEAAIVRRALRARRVPSVFLSDQDSVLASDEASDLLHWLRAVAEPQDQRLVRTALATTLIGMPLCDLVRVDGDDTAFDRRLDDLKALHLEWRRQGVLPMLRRTLHLFDLPARWMRETDGERKLTNVLHLAELLQAASAKLDGEQAVIRWLAERIDTGKGDDTQIVRLESDEDLVRVVTVHAAKGLEYPVVYLPFVCGVREQKAKAGEVDARMDDTGRYTIAFEISDETRQRIDLERQQEEVRLLYVALTRAQHALWLGVAPLTIGRSPKCRFTDSAFGYLVAGIDDVNAEDIAPRLHAVFGGLAGVAFVAGNAEPVPRTLLPSPTTAPALRDAPFYAASFERDWTIGSFSAFVRDLARVPMGAAMVDPAVEEEVASGPLDEEPAPPSSAPRHRFPRGALPGNFLHDLLEWLAAQRFALTTQASVREQLLRRCERQGWGHRANDVAVWMGEVVSTSLPPIGTALQDLRLMLPEMEFWLPSEGVAAQRIDRLCRHHLLAGRERPALPERALRGMLMGFADLVFEVDGRYWVLDYKSNALGADDAAYTRDALARSMADHRYDVQAAIYLLALHRLLRQRLGDGYDPARHLGGALYLFIRGIAGPEAGCHVVEAEVEWLDALDRALGDGA
jgi:exodeoxyribonuclease V beta subunit